jgi:hypothetical protein
VWLAQFPRQLSSPAIHVRSPELTQLRLNPIMSYMHPEGQKPRIFAVFHEDMDLLARLAGRLVP